MKKLDNGDILLSVDEMENWILQYRSVIPVEIRNIRLFSGGPIAKRYISPLAEGIEAETYGALIRYIFLNDFSINIKERE